MKRSSSSIKTIAAVLIVGAAIPCLCACSTFTLPPDGRASINALVTVGDIAAIDGSLPLLNADNAEEFLSSPDRGLRMEVYITLGDPLGCYPGSKDDPYEAVEKMIEKYAPDRPVVAQTYVYLSNYLDKDLDETAYSQLKRYMELFRDKGVRMLLRFAYQTESTADAKYSRVCRHMDGIKKFFEDNYDLVNSTLYCLQAGVIGAWGEGHSYSNMRENQIAKTLDKVCSIAPEGVYVQVRTADFASKISSKYHGKVAMHDDYLVGDMTHSWAFVPDNNENFAELMTRFSYTVNDGEMPWGRAKMNDAPDGEPLDSIDGKAIVKQIAAYHLTTLSLEHNYREEEGKSYSMAKWKDQYVTPAELKEMGVPYNPNLFKNSRGEEVPMSIYDYIRYHLGYHLVASNLSVEKGRLNFSVNNFGMAAPLNFNDMYIVCTDKNGKETEYRINGYVKGELQPMRARNFNIELPAGTVAYRVGLRTNYLSDVGITLLKGELDS